MNSIDLVLALPGPVTYVLEMYGTSTDNTQVALTPTYP